MTDFAALAGRIPRDRFWPLPRPLGPGGQPRRTGVEIEFSGLTERDAAQVVAGLWGGTVRADAPHEMTVEGTRLGDIRIELDTALRDKAESAFAAMLLDLSREIVPVEIVTPPLPPEDLPRIGALMTALEKAGAQGSEDGLLLAFGIHLNPEIAAETAGFIVPIVRAFALVEDWLRAADPPDLTRRLLPFIAPWPRGFADLAAREGADWTLDDLCAAYLEHVPSRNHGLDLLPLLEHLFPDRVRATLEGQAKGPRPTWHYRLPETCLGNGDWSIAYEWNRWVLVERVAADTALLEALATAWQAHRAAWTTVRPDWAQDVHDLIAEAALWDG